jgi:hypothetical protein
MKGRVLEEALEPGVRPVRSDRASRDNSPAPVTA